MPGAAGGRRGAPARCAPTGAPGPADGPHRAYRGSWTGPLEQTEAAAAERQPCGRRRRGPHVVVAARGTVDLQRRQRRAERGPPIGLVVEPVDVEAEALLGEA